MKFNYTEVNKMKDEYTAEDFAKAVKNPFFHYEPLFNGLCQKTTGK